jgi:Fis family transcriptional regulator, factor for inversion stimulation protein
MNQPLSPSIGHDTDIIAPEVNSTTSVSAKSGTLREAVRATVKEYFLKLDGATPYNLYELFLAEMESPLLEMVLQFCHDNQSLAAKLLNISRGTLRKKMAEYGFLKAKKRLR